ncbi:hypothetical protein PHYBLDRAFT_184638 [Phycomyces blakesleeanus NRRL 1555(-)]|uniref:MULE transposase domain-containing protein n=1 Tax=Phycomyces blakesleeanus (strain ATCC 8743b / DSM 1359 / FGSC 10004 / NBRC 33097 / NRRL 1555) TaxID=763407 RepID=A0A167RFU1_PHYB8|nr:hypothetical protein PHYBLDRAFT_184638 [Phycomyces blakesleeanus NRRL 1555(-)]OAD81554.1 hypothetical protein PHYBLDRAFT_184638 [Phycomyces blakesleeanus NRRL 1555(-)]|eukprot:XP_018299594.1 hypothetical protein PHYBLDRAFT_184638 [Phycomyces blakesleeanus NRRL 1555(-)]
MTLRLENIIRVKTSEWKECLTEIGEACTVKWVIRNTNKQPTNITAEDTKATGIKLCFSQKYSCHCWGTYESKTALRVIQKQTKKNKCPALLCVKGFFKTSELYEFVVTKDHAEHTPGDMRSDIYILPLAKKYLHELAQIDMLRAVDRYGRKSERKVNYYDIWNSMNKINKKLSIGLCLLFYVIYAASVVYTSQLSEEQTSQSNTGSFLLMNLGSLQSLELLHIRHMYTTHSYSLQFLKTSFLLVDTKQFTINCCTAEVHAIQISFPATPIQFCIFHITQAWNQKLSDSVKILGSSLSEARILHGVMMKSLQEIIYEEDIDEFHYKIVQFKEDFDDQESFLDYFERNWCTEAKFKIWSRAYHKRQFSYMLTNNYIESWHNQLKTVFMKKSRNKRLDKLVFVLVLNIEYYLTQKYKHVMANNGPMSSFTRQQRIHEMEAEEVDDDDREMMIVAPGIAKDSQTCLFPVPALIISKDINLLKKFLRGRIQDLKLGTKIRENFCRFCLLRKDFVSKFDEVPTLNYYCYLYCFGLGKLYDWGQSQ